MRKLVTTRQELEALGTSPDAFVMRAMAEAPEQMDGRRVAYVFSDDSVARDGHTIASNGWALANFRKNPIFLWAHDANALPIGKVVEVGAAKDKLRGIVEYFERDLYPFADTVYQMVKNRYLNAVSVSWLPLEWKFSTDKSRMNGIDFLRQELLEVSQVPVPALASALAEARAAGIDTAPMIEWAEKVLDTGGMMLVPRAELETLRKNAGATPKTTVLTPKSTVRGLYTVSDLAACLSFLKSIAASAEWEEEYEGDDSDIPARLLALAQELGQILVDMTVEEVTEMFAGTGEDGGDVDFVEVFAAAAKTPGQRILVKLGLLARKMKEAEGGEEILTASEVDDRIKRALEVFNRKGRKISAENEKNLQTARDLVDGVLAQVKSEDDEEARAAAEAARRELPPSDAEKKEARLRKARALKLKAN